MVERRGIFRLNIGLPGPFSISAPVRLPRMKPIITLFLFPFLLIWYTFLAGLYLVAGAALVVVYAIGFTLMLVFKIVQAIGGRSKV
jgi:hypothetical protein